MIAYLNCFSGISGDMLLGSLVDAGVPLEELKKRLSRLPVRGYELKASKVKRAGIAATKVDVIVKPEVKSQKSKVGAYGHTSIARKWKDIEKIVKSSKLSKEIKQKGLHVFKRLFQAEAKAHGEKYKNVHLHELGAVDCIVDIFGTIVGLDILKIDAVYSSSLNLGGGTVRTGHGLLPVPAPATACLLEGVPVYSSGIEFELTTPTGAALVSTLAKGFGNIPAMKILKTCTGAGNKNFKGQPNVLTMIVGEQTAVSACLPDRQGQRPEERITVIETNIDDMNPQIYKYVMKKLFKAGALDVCMTQVIMKKGRPGIILTALCDESERDRLIRIILSETTSIGVRFYQAERRVLQRQIRSVKTKHGKVRIKISRIDNNKTKTSVEYKDCRKIAEKYDIPLIEVLKSIKQ